MIITIPKEKNRLKPSKLRRSGSEQSKSIHPNGHRFMDTTGGLIRHGEYFTFRLTIRMNIGKSFGERWQMFCAAVEILDWEILRILQMF